MQATSLKSEQIFIFDYFLSAEEKNEKDPASGSFSF